jgi:hypothetical protein
MVIQKISVGARVTFPEKPLLPDGYIKKHVYGLTGELVGYFVKLDKKAPNQYAYNTDEFFEFAAQVKEI